MLIQVRPNCIFFIYFVNLLFFKFKNKIYNHFLNLIIRSIRMKIFFYKFIKEKIHSTQSILQNLRTCLLLEAKIHASIKLILCYGVVYIV